MELGEPGFELDAKAVCDSVDVGVVRGDGTDIEDVSIAEPGISQVGHVGVGHVSWGASQFLHIREHCNPLLTQARITPVNLDCFEQLVVFEEAPQTAAMVCQSVVALIDAADHEGDQLPLDPSKGSCARHGSVVDTKVALHCSRIQ